MKLEGLRFRQIQRAIFSGCAFFLLYSSHRWWRKALGFIYSMLNPKPLK